jgi:hypothetical protein
MADDETWRQSARRQTIAVTGLSIISWLVVIGAIAVIRRLAGG